MAIKNIIAGGIGFSPGSVKFIPTRGFIAAAVVAATIPTHDPNARFRPGYAPFTFPPKRFPPAYVKTR